VSSPIHLLFLLEMTEERVNRITRRHVPIFYQGSWDRVQLVEQDNMQYSLPESMSAFAAGLTMHVTQQVLYSGDAVGGHCTSQCDRPAPWRCVGDLATWRRVSSVAPGDRILSSFATGCMTTWHNPTWVARLNRSLAPLCDVRDAARSVDERHEHVTSVSDCVAHRAVGRYLLQGFRFKSKHHCIAGTIKQDLLACVNQAARQPAIGDIRRWNWKDDGDGSNTMAKSVVVCTVWKQPYATCKMSLFIIVPIAVARLLSTWHVSSF